jgi:hypothetical protein
MTIALDRKPKEIADGKLSNQIPLSCPPRRDAVDRHIGSVQHVQPVCPSEDHVRHTRADHLVHKMRRAEPRHSFLERHPVFRAYRLGFAGPVLGDPKAACGQPVCIDLLVFGSDWPVLTLAGGYKRWMTTFRTLIGELSADGQESISRGSAIAVKGSGEGKDELR